MRAFGGVHEVTIRRAIWGRHLHVCFGDSLGVGRAREQYRHAGAERQRAEFAPRHRAARHVVFQIVVVMVLITHAASPDSRVDERAETLPSQSRSILSDSPVTLLSQ
jgi:hypothetical protein